MSSFAFLVPPTAISNLFILWVGWCGLRQNSPIDSRNKLCSGVTCVALVLHFLKTRLRPFPPYLSFSGPSLFCFDQALTSRRQASNRVPSVHTEYIKKAKPQVLKPPRSPLPPSGKKKNSHGKWEGFDHPEKRGEMNAFFSHCYLQIETREMATSSIPMLSSSLWKVTTPQNAT